MSDNFDLEERTAKIGENIIKFCQKINVSLINESLIKQLIRSSTSIGANYMEANGGNSKRDFKNKISICKKEAKETEHWLRMLSICLPEKRGILRELWKEIHQLVLIFSKIQHSLQ